MDTFLTWVIRNPFVALAGCSLALSLAAVTDWSLGLTGMTVGGVLASIANRLLRKRATRAESARQSRDREMHGTIVTGRFQNLENNQGRGKAA